LSGPNAGSFILGTNTIPSIAVGASGNVTVMPILGLSGGTYHATVTISGSNGISASMNVSVTVLDAAAFEQEVLDLTNAERAQYGHPPLQWHPQLAEVARAHSIDMVTRNFFAHNCPSGTNPGNRITQAGISWWTWAENIARGQQTPAQVVASWMNSPGHRANILNPNQTHLGVGFHNNYWTQKFIGA